ncbi:single-stranded DNA-binding protein [Nitratifractor salsuginis]|uniref:Single-stranded DNA-binding protein n=1 Tax=Nitratifractor salsuginis (strain DSM 16511 / JCM 12458 / E9I37-1) TaxID=749222 RepID=E6WYD3_NITSE|nr:single-stranded DNA-binding protein [Nitratifractor salsuginis]ADV46445.1 single-strand binding protein [Nitratifractor salsuginis DSM 16511]
MNTVIVLGTLTSDVDLRFSKSGNAIGKFSLAYNKKYKASSGQMEEKVSFFDCVAFGGRAETIQRYFQKGSRILIQGELEQQTWTTNDGGKRSRVVINILGFDFVDRKSGGQSPRQPQTPPGGQYADIPDDEIPY